ncbi:MAG: class I SAM-dependent RNA methyltransferase [Phycisphaerae bacterium]|nr:class I SAM-dependent RNA methyltransferase [Gemmatimonadaceae bacterium]
MPETFAAFAIAPPGIAPLVAGELTALGISPLEVSEAGVGFTASRRDLARANLWLRMASRVIVRLDTFHVTDFATLEKRAKLVPWSDVLRAGAHVQLRVICRKSRLYHSDAVAERVARAIEAKVAGSRVDLRASDEEGENADMSAVPAQLILVRMDRDQCTISPDSSGALLNRRGWRQAVAKAPIRETLAATLITASHWDMKSPLVDPFAGSGTIAIEAALRARNLAPGIARRFAIEVWPNTHSGLLGQLRKEAHSLAVGKAGVPIIAGDRDAGACAAALANAERAGVEKDIEIVQRSVSATDLAAIAEGGFVVTNPPYGVRVSPGNDLRSLYQRVGDVMRAGGRGWHITLLAAERALVGQLKLKTQVIVKTTNGGLPVTIEGN